MTGGVWEEGYFTLITRTLLLSATHHTKYELDFYSFQRFSNRSTGKPLYRDHQRLMFYITDLRILVSSPRKFEGKIEFTFTPRLIDMVRYGRLNILGCQAVPLSQAGTHQCGWLIWVIKSRCDD